MPYCIKCGVELKPNAKFCHNCGEMANVIESRIPPRQEVVEKAVEPDINLELIRVTSFEEMRNYAHFTRNFKYLLNKLHPIAETTARAIFWKLKASEKKIRERQSSTEVSNTFSFLMDLDVHDCPVSTWLLTIDPTSDGPDALFVHIELSASIPYCMGYVVFKLRKGTFLDYLVSEFGSSRTRAILAPNKLKRRLGLSSPV